MSGRPASWQVIFDNTASTVEPSDQAPDPGQHRYPTFGAAKRRLVAMLTENRDAWAKALRDAHRLTQGVASWVPADSARTYLHLASGETGSRLTELLEQTTEGDIADVSHPAP